jgi:hypothetical protein
LPGGRIVLDQQYGCHHPPLSRRSGHEPVLGLS